MSNLGYEVFFLFGGFYVLFAGGVLLNASIKGKYTSNIWGKIAVFSYMAWSQMFTGQSAKQLKIKKIILGYISILEMIGGLLILYAAFILRGQT